MSFLKTVVTTLALVSISLPSCFAETVLKDKKLSVAAVLGLTGYAAQHAKGMKNGFLLAVDQLKKQGWQVDYKIEDDQTNPAKTVSALHSLLAQDYRFFIGPTWSYQTKAATPILHSSGALAITPGGSSIINGGPNESVFNMCPRRDSQAPLIGNWAKEHHMRKGFILSAEGDWGVLHHKVFAKAIELSGGEIVAEEFYDYGADLSTIKSILLKASKTHFDTLYTTTSSDDIANIIRARDELKMNFSIMTTDTIADAKRLGLVTSKQLSNVYMSYLPTSEEFMKLHKEHFHEDALTYSDRAYDAVMALAVAVLHTDGSVESVRKYLHSDNLPSGMTGPLKFDASGDIIAANYEVIAMGDA